MSNKTNGLSRLSPGQPKNIPELAAAAKNFYGTGRKMEGINAICDALELLSLGVKRQFNEDAVMLGRLVDFEKNLDKSIKFHESNQNDPHGISNAVLTALREVRSSLHEVLKAPVKEEKPA